MSLSDFILVAHELEGDRLVVAFARRLHLGLVADHAIMSKEKIVAVGMDDGDHLVIRPGHYCFDDGRSAGGHFVLYVNIHAFLAFFLASPVAGELFELLEASILAGVLTDDGGNGKRQDNERRQCFACHGSLLRDVCPIAFKESPI